MMHYIAQEEMYTYYDDLVFSNIVVVIKIHAF